MNLTWQQIVGLFILGVPIACVARTVVFEEVFREPREYCQRMSKACRSAAARKFFYLFTCEYCFSHWVTLVVLLVTRYHLMYDGWKGSLVAFFSLVFVANSYMNLYSRLRVDITSEKKEIEVKEKTIEARDKQIEKIECELAEAGARGNGR